MQTTTAHHGVEPSVERSDAMSWGVAAAAAVAAAAIVVQLRAWGVLQGWPALVVTAVLVLAVPTARDLSRRILLAVPIMLGAVPLTYLVVLPVGGLGRATLGLAVIAAALAGWVGRSPRPLDRLGRLVPRVRTVDLLAGGAVVASVAQNGPWLFTTNGSQSLALMLRGWDHSSHFFMTEAARRTGGLADALGTAASGDAYKFDTYPSGFHSVPALVMELLGGPTVGSASGELLLYSHAVGALAVMLLAAMVAGLCSLPRLRATFALALPLATLLTVAFTFGPGGTLLHDGFPNFLGACAMLVVLPMLVATWARVGHVPTLIAVGGALAAVADSWAPLLALAAPAVALGALPMWRRRWRARPVEWVVLGAVVAGVLVSVGHSYLVLSRITIGFTEIMQTPGAVTRPSVPIVVVLCVAAVASCTWVAVRPHAARGLRRRVGWGWVPLLAGGLVVWRVAGVQLPDGNGPQYYFWKLLIAIGLMAVSVLVVALGVRAVPPSTRSAGSRIGRGTVAVLATLVIAQLFGVAVPGLASATAQELGAPAPGVEATADDAAAIGDPTIAMGADRLIAAAALPLPEAVRPVYLDLDVAGVLNPAQATQWFLTLTGRWTEETNLPTTPLFSATDVGTAITVVRQLLLADPRAVVVAPAPTADTLRTYLADPALSLRVLTAPPPVTPSLPAIG